MFDPSSNDLKRAVRDLRTALGKTQTEFGTLIGKGLATVQRYEGLVPPKGGVLVRLADLAEKSSQRTLAGLFRAALERELGGLRSDVAIARMQEEVLVVEGRLLRLLEDFRLPAGAAQMLKECTLQLRRAIDEGYGARSKTRPAELEDS